MKYLFIKARQSDLGDGFVVRRSLPSAKKKMVGPFIFWDHMGPVKIEPHFAMKVRAHPHIGLATLTYLFSGEIMHRDTLGNRQLIRPGEVNWMTAGRGIAHSERANGPQSYAYLEGIQLWVALPKESEDVPPNFQHIAKDDLPTIDCGDSPLLLIAGEYNGIKSPVNTYSPLFYLHGRGHAQQTLQLMIPKGMEGAVYLASGRISMDGEEFGPGDLLVFEDQGVISLNVIEGTHIMFFGGQPLPEGRHIWWNFVATTTQRIDQAKQDWLNNKFGQVIDETEFIPLPDH